MRVLVRGVGASYKERLEGVDARAAEYDVAFAQLFKAAVVDQ
jgi:hypothetical protein